jgi:hypothetical protein
MCHWLKIGVSVHKWKAAVRTDRAFRCPRFHVAPAGGVAVAPPGLGGRHRKILQLFPRSTASRPVVELKVPTPSLVYHDLASNPLPSVAFISRAGGPYALVCQLKPINPHPPLELSLSFQSCPYCNDVATTTSSFGPGCLLVMSQSACAASHKNICDGHDSSKPAW